jgi:hypothetical protein
MNTPSDIPRVVQDQLLGYDSQVSVELLLVRYTFDFPMTLHVVAGDIYIEIGRNDVATPAVLSAADGHMFMLANGSVGFVNSSFPQFLESVAAWTDLATASTPDTPTQTRVSEFDARVKNIDPAALQGAESFWSQIREEMQYGII